MDSFAFGVMPQITYLLSSVETSFDTLDCFQEEAFELGFEFGTVFLIKSLMMSPAILSEDSSITSS